MPKLDHLTKNEPIFQWCFRLTFPEISGIEEFISTSALPKDAVNVVPVRFKNYDKTIAGREIHQQHTFSVKGYVSPNTAARVWKWFKLVYHSNVVGAPKSYKRDGQISLTDGRSNPVTRWKMIGCWPSQVDLGEGSYSNADLVEITATIEVDDIELED